jgi:WD40 repeat protein
MSRLFFVIRASQSRAVRQRRVLVGSAAAAAAFAVISAVGGLAFLQRQRALFAIHPFLSVVYGLAVARPVLDGKHPWKTAQLTQSLQETTMTNVPGSAPIATGQGWVRSLIELKNGELISGGDDGTLRRWRDGKPVGDGKPIATGQDKVWSLIELKNGEVISGGFDGTLRRWRDGKPVGGSKPIVTARGVSMLSLIELKNGELISGYSDGTLRRWRDGKAVGDGKPIVTHQGLCGDCEPIVTDRGLEGVYSLIELKNGEVISGGSDGTLRRFRDGKAVGDGKPIITDQWGVMSLIELKNGELISGGSDGTLRRWRDGKAVGDGKPIATGQGQVMSLIELKNGELISGGNDGTLRRWHPAPIARSACRQIDLASIPTEAGLAPVVEAAQATCRKTGVLK